MKNVTISLENATLEQARERAQMLGQSFNEYVRNLLRREMADDPYGSLKEAWARADEESIRLDGPIPDREARNAR